MTAEQRTGMHRRLEAAEKLEPVLAELLARPMRRRELLLGHLLVAEVERNEEVVGVAVDARTAELAQEVDALDRLRAALRDVAERDDQVGLEPLQVAERRAKCDGVAVHVRDEGDAHRGTL